MAGEHDETDERDEKDEKDEKDERDETDERDDEKPQSLEAAHERIGALERELNETRRESIKRRDKIKTLDAELAKERESKMDETERAVEAAKRETREALEGEHRTERVRSAVLLAGATKLKDPQDAIRYLNLDELAEHEDGDLDKAAAKAVEKLVEEKDYLAAGGDEAVAGARSQGVRTRQAAGTRQGEGPGVNERIRKSLKH
jgi:hypothetical protein